MMMESAEGSYGDELIPEMCKICNIKLNGRRYVMKNQQATCRDCYNKMEADRCDKCIKVIKIDEKEMTYRSRHWHEACFNCDNCQCSLSDKQFIRNEGGAIHCIACFDELFSKKCNDCTKPLKHGQRQYEYSDKYFHEDCFKCGDCHKKIGTSAFVPRDDVFICMTCHEQKYAQKCGVCRKTLLQGGVTFRDAAFHRECFTCTACRRTLADVKFATKDDLPYCTECYVNKFSKMCQKCFSPISGIGTGTKFVSLEKHHWHAECFTCVLCGTNLSGLGFLMHQGDVICKPCGSNM